MANNAEDEIAEFIKGKWAITWSPDEGFSLITPNMGESQDEKHVPPQAIALTACMLRLDLDPPFREEMMEWFKHKRQS